MIHERLPLVVEGDTTEVQQRLRTGQGPVNSGPFHPILDHMAAGPLDHARGNGIARSEVLIVMNPGAVAVEIIVNLFQPGAAGSGQLGPTRPSVATSGHARAHAAQQAQDQQFLPL